MKGLVLAVTAEPCFFVQLWEQEHIEPNTSQDDGGDGSQVGGWQGTKASRENRKPGRHAGRLCATVTDIKEHRQCRAGTTVFQRLGSICCISLLTPYAGPPARWPSSPFQHHGPVASFPSTGANSHRLCNKRKYALPSTMAWMADFGQVWAGCAPAGPGGSSDPKLRDANHVVLGPIPPHQSVCVASNPSSAVALYPPPSSDCGFTNPPGHA